MNTFKNFMVLLFASMFQLAHAQTLDVHIRNIHATKGQLCIAIFTDEACFAAEKTIWEAKCKKELVVDGDFLIKIPIKPGKYGLSVLDDENMSGKMEYSLFGIPREGFGFSDYYHKGIRKPSFEDFSFIVEKDEIRVIAVYMKYF